MSERPRISVLRFRQLSTGRFYVPGDELDQRRGVRERREPTACPLELPSRAVRLTGLRPVPRRPEVVEPADELLLVVREAEDVREPARRDEVLTTLDRALGVPEGGLYPGLAGRPLLVHGANVPAAARSPRPHTSPVERIRFYFDVVCPYSYMESHVVEAAEDAGRLEVEWLPFELRPAPKPLLEVRGDHLRTDWTEHVYRRALQRGRDPPAALPAALDADARDVPLGGRRGTAAGLQARALRGVLLRGPRHRDRRRRSRARPGSPASIPSTRWRLPTTTAASTQLREIRREAEAAGVAGVPTLLTEDGRTHWGMGGVERLLADEPLVPRGDTRQGRCDGRRRSRAERRPDRARDRDALRAGRSREQRGDPPLRLHAGVPADARPLHRARSASSASTVTEDPVGTLVARNRPPGEPAFGIGSHCDSNRNGGQYDGTLGVVTALEVCRLNEEHGLGLPLQLVSFLEEEGSGFGQMLLGSRIMLAARHGGRPARALPRDRRRAQLLGARRGGGLRARAVARVDPRARRARRAGSRCTSSRRACSRTPASGSAWSTRSPGYVHADVRVQGRGDHAGATPMDLRLDPTTVLAETVARARAARDARPGTGRSGRWARSRSTRGSSTSSPASVRFSLDIRGPEDARSSGVARAIARVRRPRRRSVAG